MRLLTTRRLIITRALRPSAHHHHRAAPPPLPAAPHPAPCSANQQRPSSRAERTKTQPRFLCRMASTNNNRESARTTLRLVLVSAVAMIDQNGRVLLAQRPEGKAMAGLWEFPGGKVEPNETPEAALARELYEELRVNVDPAALTPISFASHTYDSFHLLMPLYACTSWSGEPQGAEGQSLEWADPDSLDKYSMPAADIPLIEPVRRAAKAVRNVEAKR